MEVGAYSTFVADYVGLVWYGSPVTQASLTVAHSSGIYLNVWGSTGFNSDWSTNWDDEIDWNIGWSGPVGFGGLVADVSIGYWDCFGVGSKNDNDFVGFNLAISRPFELGEWSVTPAVILQIVRPISEETWDDGSVWGVNVKVARDLCRIATFTTVAGVYFDGGSYGTSPATIAEVSASLDWKLRENLTLSLPSVRVVTPLRSVDRETQVIWGAVATLTF